MKTKFASFALAIIAAVSTAFGQPTTFTKITTGPVVTDQGQFIRGAWVDLRNSGFLDLIVCGWNQTNVYYRNNGDGTFTRIVQGEPIQDADYHSTPIMGDYDNDGFPDLLVTAGAAAPFQRRSMLYHNRGDGTLSPVSGSGITNQLGYFDAAAAADYDNDGLLDLAQVDDGTGLISMWHNRGQGVFTRVTSAPWNLPDSGSLFWADYDNDGFMDLLVKGKSTINYLFHNNRDGTFLRIFTNSVVTDQWPGGIECATWGDYDNDGLQDLFITGDNGSTNRLYHNNGDGTFTVIPSAMDSRPTGANSLACAWGDYDNDGYLDLFVTTHGGHNALYHNNGNGTFTQILSGDPVNDGGPEWSLGGWVDYDNDGFLDLFVSRNNLSQPSISNLLYHNDGNTNAWLEVKLKGTASNCSAIGAKVRVQATIRGQSMWQMREVSQGGGRWVQPLVAHFGLGDATNVNTVRIEWPSGIVQTLTNVMPRQILSVTEHQQVDPLPPRPILTGISRPPNGLADLSVTGETGLLYLLEGSTDLVNWTWVGVRSNATGAVQFSDPASTNYPSRFYRVSIP